MAAIGKKERLMISVMLTIGMAFGWMNYLYDPAAEELEKTIKKYNGLVKEVNDLGQTPLNNDALRKRVKPLRQQKAALQAEVKMYSEALLARGEAVDEVVFQVNDAARSSVVRVHEFTPIPLKEASMLNPGLVKEFEKMERSLYKVRCSGNFLDLFSFINDVSRMERLVTLESMVIIKAKEPEGNVDMEFFLAI